MKVFSLAILELQWDAVVAQQSEHHTATMVWILSVLAFPASITCQAGSTQVSWPHRKHVGDEYWCFGDSDALHCGSECL